MSANAGNVFGEQVGRYTLLEKLGEGGMAAVYNAYDAHRGKNVAIKIILPSKRDSKVFLERFTIESKSLAQLSHTNIVKVLDYGETNGNPYLVMEYVPGGTLKEFMTEAVPYPLAAKILLPVARALEYVHAQGIIHRDVKPANILIDEDDQPKLSDFGVIQLLESKEQETVTGVGIGTPDYMSPEQGMGKGVDHRADIYALGVIFYELITGKKPYTAETPMAIAIKHATEPFPKPSKTIKHLPKVVEDVLMKAVAKDPAKRYQSIGEFADALEIIALGKGLKNARLRKLVSTPKPQIIQPMPRLAWVGMALLLVLLCAFFTRGIWVPLIPGSTPAVVEIPITPEETAGSSANLSPTETVGITPAITQVEAEKATNTATLPTKTAPTGNPVTDTLPYPEVIKKLSDVNLRKIDLWGFGGITNVAWAPDKSQFAIGTTEGVVFYDGDTYQMVKFIDLDEWVDLVTYSEDGRFYVGLHSGVVLALSLINNFQQITHYSYSTVKSSRIGSDNTSPVQAIAIHQDAKLIAIGYQNGAIQIIDLPTATTITTFELYPSVKSIIFSQDGRLLYTTRDESRLLGIFDLESKQLREVKLPGSISQMILSEDGSMLILGGQGQAIYLWSTAEEKLLYSFVGLEAQVTSLSTDPSGQRITAGLANGVVDVFRIPAEDEYSSTLSAMLTTKVQTESLTGVSYSQDGERIATTSTHEGLKVINATSGEVLFAMDRRYPAVTRMEFSPNSQWLAVDYADGVVRVFNPSNGDLLFEFSGRMPTGDPFSHDGRYLIIQNYNGQYSLSVVEYPSGQIVQTLKDIGSQWRVSFSPDDLIFVAGTTTNALIWDVKTWNRISTHGGPNSGCGMFYTLNNQLLATIWDSAVIFELNSKIEILCSSKPTFARSVHLAADHSYAVFENNEGGLWTFHYNPDEISRMRTTRINRDDEHFMGNSRDDRFYLLEKPLTLNLTNSAFSSIHAFPNQDLYDFQAAISTDDRLLALASKFGNISIWGVKE